VDPPRFNQEKEKTVFKCILVPTDGSPLSHKVVKRAVQLAKEQKAKVIGFHVVPPYQPRVSDDYVAPDFISPRQYAEIAKKRAAKHLDFVKRAAEAAGVSCTCSHAASEFPYMEIVKAAQRNRCDLIVMASHGRRGLSRLLLGSETSKVLAHSKIPVLVAH
jgi:nucleotide-binding universal stress UspA family protein